MSHPKEAWKFKLWTDAMLRGAIVGNPEYKGKASSSANKGRAQPQRQQRRRRRKRKRHHGSKD